MITELVSHMDPPDGVIWGKNANGQYRWVTFEVTFAVHVCSDGRAMEAIKFAKENMPHDPVDAIWRQPIVVDELVPKDEYWLVYGSGRIVKGKIA